MQVLLLDEPTSHLDAKTTSAFEAVVKNLGSAVVCNHYACTYPILDIRYGHHVLCDPRHNVHTQLLLSATGQHNKDVHAFSPARIATPPTV